METLDRYLGAIRPLLPMAQRDDIMAELTEEIRSQIGEREVELGRSLDEAELKSILDRYGDPMMVGGRYQPDQGSLVFGRELIGRELFPFYLGALKMTFAISMAIHVAIIAGLSILGLVTVGDVLGSFWIHLGVQFTVLTLVFCGFQSQLTKNPDRWAVQRPVEVRGPSTGAIRAESVAEAIVVAVFVPWLLRALGTEPVVIGNCRLAPIVHSALWPILGALILTIAQAIAIAVRPDWVRLRHPARAVGYALWVATLAWLFRAGAWIVPNYPAAQKEAEAINDVVLRNGLAITLIFMVICLAWEMISVWKTEKKLSREAR